MDEPKYKRYFCVQPFSTASVNANGEVFLCCAAFLKDSAGNLLERSFPEVWNSEAAQDLRRTILDGSYSHCIEARCPFLQGEVLLQTKDEITDPIYRDIIDNERTELATGPRELHAAYDTTCNLACPYCRSEYIALKGEELNTSEHIHNQLVAGALAMTDTLVISSQGDPFASKLYSKILREFDAEKFPQLRLRITTNGILFTPENWEAIRPSHGALEHIHVSVNGASKRSFEENQRGGSWEKLLENLDFLSRECRQNGDKKRFVTLSFIVQKNNYREMPDFVRMVQDYGFDRALFGMIFHADRTYSDAEFAKLPVHWQNHPEHQEFQRVMSDPTLRAPEACIIGGMAVHLPPLRKVFGHQHADAISGAQFIAPQGVAWTAWAEEQGISSMEGVSSPKMIDFAKSGDAPIRIAFDDFAEMLELDEEQRPTARQALSDMHDAVVELLTAPAAEGDTAPLHAAVDAVREGRVDSISGAIIYLFQHAAKARPAGARATYHERFSRTELDYRQRIQRLLNPRQRKRYHALPIGSLYDIDIAREPLANRLRAEVLGLRDAVARERMPWQEFVQMLGLGELQQIEAKALLIAFKERVAAVLGEASAVDGISPLMRIAESLRDTESVPTDLDAVLRTHSPEVEGPTYAERIGALQGEALKALAQMLPSEKRYRATWLPISSLVGIDIPRHDPIGAAVASLLRNTPAAC